MALRVIGLFPRRTEAHREPNHDGDVTRWRGDDGDGDGGSNATARRIVCEDFDWVARFRVSESEKSGTFKVLTE